MGFKTPSHDSCNYFDIAPGATVPDIKFYTPVRRYRPLANGITDWMTSCGRGEYSKDTWTCRHDLTERRKLEDIKDMQTYVVR